MCQLLLLHAHNSLNLFANSYFLDNVELVNVFFVNFRSKRLRNSLNLGLFVLDLT